MTRVFTEGFEMGDILFFDTGTTPTIESTTKRSGSYSCAVPTTAAVKTLASAVSEFYLRAGVYLSSGTSTQIINWQSAGTVLGSCRVVDNKVVMISGTGSTATATGAISVPTGAWFLLEIRVKIADGASGIFECKVDGVADISYAGDTKPGTATTVNQIGFLRSSGTTIYIDDLALDDAAYPGDGKIIALVPNGNGDSSQLTGSDGNSTDNYLLVDDIPMGTGVSDDYTESATADQYDLYALTNTGWASGVTINGVYPEARALDTVAAGGNCQLGVKPSGASEDWSSNISLLTTATQTKGKWYTTKPAGGAWSISDVDGVQAGFKVK
jgi:hypothetical protein